MSESMPGQQPNPRRHVTIYGPDGYKEVRDIPSLGQEGFRYSREVELAALGMLLQDEVESNEQTT